jgi:hypothetical protein
MRGQTHLPGSFIHYAVTRWLALDVRSNTTDLWTGVCFVVVAMASIILEIRDARRRRPLRSVRL